MELQDRLIFTQLSLSLSLFLSPTSRLLTPVNFPCFKQRIPSLNNSGRLRVVFFTLIKYRRLSRFFLILSSLFLSFSLSQYLFPTTHASKKFQATTSYKTTCRERFLHFLGTLCQVETWAWSVVLVCVDQYMFGSCFCDLTSQTLKISTLFPCKVQVNCSESPDKGPVELYKCAWDAVL